MFYCTALMNKPAILYQLSGFMKQAQISFHSSAGTSNVIFPVFSQILKHWIPQCHCYWMLSVHFKLAEDMAWMKSKHRSCQFRSYFCKTKLLANFHIHHEFLCAETSSFKLRYSCLCLINSNNYFYFQLWWYSPAPKAQLHNFWVTAYVMQDNYIKGQCWSINKGKRPSGDYCQKSSSSDMKKTLPQPLKLIPRWCLSILESHPSLLWQWPVLSAPKTFVLLDK